MEKTTANEYWEMALRRKWWIAIASLLTLLAGLTYTLITPKIYRADTLILVQPQKVPEDFVRAIVSSNVEDRLRTITQQVTSRTNLEKILVQTKLYENDGEEVLLDDKVGMFRRDIKIDVSHGGGGTAANAFTIAFRGRDPVKVTEVTNMLASNFMSENLKIREAQAMGTSSFIATELESVKRRLTVKEEELKTYRKSYMGGLPEQLQTNLSILERLQDQIDQLTGTLRDLENRKILLQKQIADQRRADAARSADRNANVNRPRDLDTLMKELGELQAKYTEDHPDVIRLRSIIAGMRERTSRDDRELTPNEISRMDVERALRNQVRDTELEISSLKVQIRKARAQINAYQDKVEDTPKREQELLGLKRDYESLKDLYGSLLKRKLEADIAVSMERKQKGEQFRVIDSAKMPMRPIEPDLRRILVITVLLGLLIGGGVGYLRDTLDTSYKTPTELEQNLRIPVLVSMAIQMSDEETRRRKWKDVLATASLGLGFVVCALTIVLAIKGVGKTMRFLGQLLSNT